MTDTQLFKRNDIRDQKLEQAVESVTSLLSSEKDDFYNGAWEAFPLADVLYDLGRDPMSGVITKETFRQSFFAIHKIFTRAGTFEFYLDVFRAVWGEDVEVEFTIPQDGHLQININALSIQLFNFTAREIIDNTYQFFDIIDHEGNEILFQDTQGIKTQRETDALVFQLHPAGVFVETTLVVG